MLGLLRFAWRAPVHKSVHPPALVAETSDAPGPDAPAWSMARGGSPYWPQHELDSFILQMAGHGRAVHAAMMLGDTDYARQQLAAAAAMQCPQLQALSARLNAYFNRSACPAMADIH